MTPEQLAALFSPDLNLSAAARSLIAYVATLGDAEIPYARIERFLQVHDERKLRRIVGEAEDAGWITVDRQTGKGHNPRFTFTPAKNAPLSYTPAENAGLNSYTPAENAGVNAAPYTPTDIHPSPPPTTRVHEPPSDMDVARLRSYLGDHARAVDLMLESADHSAVWVAAVLGKYGPSGTQLRIFTGIPPDRRPAVLATALMEFATTGKVFGNQHFDGFIRKAVQHEQQPDDAGRTSGRGRDSGGPPATPRAAAGGSKQRSGWVYE